MSIHSDIESVLQESGYVVKQQGDFPENATLPTTFITYFVISAGETAHSSNGASVMEYLVQVALYSKDESIARQANTILDDLLKPNNYLKAGGRDLGLYKPSHHYAYAIDYRKYYQV